MLRVGALVAAVFVLVAAASCDRDRTDSADRAPSATAPPGTTPSGCAGREVVSLVAGPRALRGTVKSCAGDTLTIAYGHPLKSKPRPEREVQATTTWDVGEPAKARVGDHGACHYGRDLWRLCEVEAAEGGRFRARSPEGQVREIDATELVVLTGTAARTVIDHFAARDAQRSFDEAVLAATFDNGALTKGQRVVAPRVGTSFYEATIVSISGDEARVRWTNDAWPERDVPTRRIGLMTSGDAELEPGRLVLWRERGSSDRFEPARVVSATETCELRDRSGETKAVPTNTLELVIATKPQK